MQKRVIGFFFFISRLLSADPLNGNLEIGTSFSDSYEARSVFVNPAAFGFQTELNGNALLSSFTYGYNRGTDSEFSLGIGYGYLGFGFEHLTSPTQPWNRFSFASGVPITHQIFLGTRYSVTGSDDPALSGNHSLDLGIQYRPFKMISLAVQGNRLNKSPSQWIGSVTLAPLEKLRLSGDVDSSSNNFGSNLGYQAIGRYEVLPGLELGGGYHNVYEWSISFQFSIGRSTLYSNFQPKPDLKRWTGGFQTTVLPSRSFLEPKSTIKVTLDHTLSEEGNPGSFFVKGEPSLLSLLKRIEASSQDPSVHSIILKIEAFPMGLAAAEEINAALLAFREKGKSVEVYLGNSGTKEYLIASAGTKISIEPSAELRILGPRSERFYFKGTLDKLGVQGEFLSKGEYKSAPESFTRKESTPQSREATLSELKALEEGIQTVLKKSRKNLPAWTVLLQHGIYSAAEAKAKGLVDEVRSFRDLSDESLAEHPLRDSYEYQKKRLDLPPSVSVIVAEGDILQRRVRLLSLAGGEQVTPEKMAKRIKAAVSDPLTKAIVVRVSSPGGEILASQEIASMIESAKKKKPVIISMGDMAASGGYMISAPGSRIFADPLTITGSIGVFLGKVSLEGLYKKMDLRKEVIGSSPYAGIYSEYKNWTPAERALMTRRVNDYYSNFVRFVAEKRKLGAGEAEQSAKGRVWAARDAIKHKLVDETGGLLEAVKYAASQAQLKEGEYTIDLIREDPGPFGLGDSDPLFMKNSSWAKEAFQLLGMEKAHELQWLTLLAEDPMLYWTPNRYLD